ncbi:MAG: hypothetical protein NC402_03860 [Prevotella sp.]|nr:hypothetical protein [Prevotella sp.]MCM1074882.1 hypothetical protein [Ruminococcus sp.]
MKKYILSLLPALIITAPFCQADEKFLNGQWEIFNTFDQYFHEIIPAQDRTYILNLGQLEYNDLAWGYWNGRRGQLFVINKDSDKLEAYNGTNKLNGNVILDIAYNRDKGYLLIVYNDYNIDILNDDDTVVSVHGLETATVGSSKTINSVNFDSANNKIYLATDFGYLVIDDEMGVIAETHLFNKKLNAVARVGENIVAATSEGLYYSPAGNRQPTFDSFIKIPSVSKGVDYILPLQDNLFGYANADGLFAGTMSATGQLNVSNKTGNTVNYYSENRNGYFLRGKNVALQLDRQGKVLSCPINIIADVNPECGSWDMKTFYFPVIRKGIQKMAYDAGGWTNQMMYTPNQPRPYGAFGFDYSNTAGMVVSNNVYNRFYCAEWMQYWDLISAYKNGTWTHYGMSDTPSVIAASLRETYAAVVDPTDNNYCWVGSLRNGLVRYDLRDHTATMYANPGNGQKNQAGFNAVFPNSPYWSIRCNVSSPSFDGDGNLWCVFNPSHAYEPQPVYCWSAEDRAAGNVSGFKNVAVQGYENHYETLICTATKTEASRGFVVFGPNTRSFNTFHLFYHAGTPFDTSDDQFYSYGSFVDQDNNVVPATFYNNFFEDPLNGNIWVLTDTGAFFFNPNEAIAAGDTKGKLKVTRVKADGEYLFNRYDVMCMAVDGHGRKWFGTNDSGLYVTNPDCTQILKVFDMTNSALPSNQIFGLGYEAATNTMWIGSSEQICKFSIDAELLEPDYASVLAFPNPVRPEYQGHVSIQGLISTAPVKITDAAGKMVRELSAPVNGTCVWDLKDNFGDEVTTGVYYIHNSPNSASAPGTQIHVIR